MAEIENRPLSLVTVFIIIVRVFISGVVLAVPITIIRTTMCRHPTIISLQDSAWLPKPTHAE